MRILSRQRIWQIRNREKSHAHQAVGRAVVTGRLVVASACEGCGAPPPLTAHHHLGYAQEHRLDVKWLCSYCHGIAHVNRNTLPADGQVAAEKMTVEQIEQLRRDYPTMARPKSEATKTICLRIPLKLYSRIERMAWQSRRPRTWQFIVLLEQALDASRPHKQTDEEEDSNENPSN